MRISSMPVALTPLSHNLVPKTLKFVTVLRDSAHKVFQSSFVFVMVI